MPFVRVIVFDADNFFQRVSSPEDCFLVEAIDADGSGSADQNYVRISHISGSGVLIGREGIGTFISGVLSGNFITGTFYGDGSSLRGVVNSLNTFTGSLEIVGGTNVTVTSGSGQIIISAVSGAAAADEKVKVSANDSTADYLFNKLLAGPNVNLVEQDDGLDEEIILSASVTSIGGFSGSLELNSGPNVEIDANLGTFSLSASVTSVNSKSGSLTLTAGENIEVVTDGSQLSLSASATSLNNLSGTLTLSPGPGINLDFNDPIIGFSASLFAGENILINSGSGQLFLSASVTSINGSSGSLTLTSGPNIGIVTDSSELSLSASVTSLNGYSGSLQINTDEILTITSASGDFQLSSSALTSASHRDIDQLVHNIAETSVQEFVYQGNNVISATFYQSNGTTKIREEIYLYQGNNVVSGTTTQYDEVGNPIVGETLTETYTYLGNNVVAITGTLS